MHPVLARIGPFTIYSYGVMVAVGFGLATLLAYLDAHKYNLDKNKILDLAIIILLSGIAGARLLYVSLNLKFYLRHPFEILNLSKGGLVWYGAFLSSLFVATWYARRNKLNFWAVADLFAPYLALAQAIGRIGCFLNGCCYGAGGHPTQIYSSIALAIIFLILQIRKKRPHFNGEIFLGYGILYTLKRFTIEFLRGDNPRTFINLTLSQLISIPLLLIFSSIFIYRTVAWRKKSTDSK